MIDHTDEMASVLEDGKSETIFDRITKQVHTVPEKVDMYFMVCVERLELST